VLPRSVDTPIRRDRAILGALYSAGQRVLELIAIDLADLFLSADS
jgi:site-specific recombinase XerD